MESWESSHNGILLACKRVCHARRCAHSGVRAAGTAGDMQHGAARVAPALKQVQRELVLGVDDPHEQQARRLQRGYGQPHDVRICELAVPQRHTCDFEVEGLGRRQILDVQS